MMGFQQDTASRKMGRQKGRGREEEGGMEIDVRCGFFFGGDIGRRGIMRGRGWWTLN